MSDSESPAKDRIFKSRLGQKVVESLWTSSAGLLNGGPDNIIALNTSLNSTPHNRVLHFLNEGIKEAYCRNEDCIIDLRELKDEAALKSDYEIRIRARGMAERVFTTAWRVALQLSVKSPLRVIVGGVALVGLNCVDCVMDKDASPREKAIMVAVSPLVAAVGAAGGAVASVYEIWKEISPDINALAERKARHLTGDIMSQEEQSVSLANQKKVYKLAI